MFRLIIVATLIHISSTVASPDDPYEDEPLLYMEARTSKYKSPKSLQSKNNFYRYTRDHGEPFMPVMDDIDTEFEDFNDEFARPTRAQKEKNDNFVRFGRGNSDFVRFGRDPYKYKDQNFLRFGRSISESELPKKRSRRDVAQVDDDLKAKRDRDNFLRFGRGGDDSFIRYGRDGVKINDGDRLPTPTKSHPFIHGQSLSYPFLLNGRLLHNSPLLSILRKLEEEMKQNN